MSIFFVKEIGCESTRHEVSMVMGLENAIIRLMGEIYNCNSVCTWFNDGEDMLVTVANGKSFDVFIKRLDGDTIFSLLEDH